jgi:hypothetical protein
MSAMDENALEGIAELICGDDWENMPAYRSSSYITRFFEAAGFPHLRHDGSTRKWWILDALNTLAPQQLEKVILRLASPREYRGDREQTRLAVSWLNRFLSLEGYKISFNGIEPQLVEAKINFEIGYEDTFEKTELKPLPPPEFLALGLENGIGELLARRWEEIQTCVGGGAHLAAIVMMGSLLEGMLLGVFQRNPKEANQAPNFPKDSKTGKNKQFYDLTLSEMIDVGHAIGWIGLDVKKFSHALRDFRNLIHPYQQMVTRMNPDEDTCNISWLVVQATANDLGKVLVGKEA